MITILQKRPWLIILAFFIGFVAWWAFFITIAVKYQPQQVPLQSAPHASH